MSKAWDPRAVALTPGPASSNFWGGKVSGLGFRREGGGSRKGLGFREERYREFREYRV